VSKPAFYDFRGRAKWYCCNRFVITIAATEPPLLPRQAWHDLGELPSSSAAERYIALVTTHLPTWHLDTSSSSSNDDSEDESSGDKTDDERSADEEIDQPRRTKSGDHHSALGMHLHSNMWLASLAAVA
jgi:hypothetical protein